MLTCVTTACFDGLPDADERMSIGKSLRVFGDGFQGSKVDKRRTLLAHPGHGGGVSAYRNRSAWRRGVGGGNFLILAESDEAALDAAEAAVDAMRGAPGVILPFPGGIVRSGSKVGAQRLQVA